MERIPEIAEDRIRPGVRVKVRFPDMLAGTASHEHLQRSFVITEVEHHERFSSGAGIRVSPAVQVNHPLGDKVWYDSKYFGEANEPDIPVYTKDTVKEVKENLFLPVGDWRDTRTVLGRMEAELEMTYQEYAKTEPWKFADLVIQHYKRLAQPVCAECRKKIIGFDIRCLDCKATLCELCAPRHFWPNGRPKEDNHVCKRTVDQAEGQVRTRDPEGSPQPGKQLPGQEVW